MDINLLGVAIAFTTFLVIGVFHPVVVKVEYYFGTKLWGLFLCIGIVAIIGALFIENTYLSAVLGVFGASSLWSIGEIFQQRKRVLKGWFPKNPKRAHEYED